MVSEAYIMEHYGKLPLDEQVKVLLTALGAMKEDNRRSKVDCISLTMGIPVFPKISTVESMKGFVVTIRFQHGELRKIDFQQFFNPARSIERQLLGDPETFAQVKVEEGTLVWPSVGITSTDMDGEVRFFPYDVDPGVLYEVSVPLEGLEV